MRDHGNLQDAWVVSKGLSSESEVQRESRDVEASIAVAGMTVDCMFVSHGFAFDLCPPVLSWLSSSIYLVPLPLLFSSVEHVDTRQEHPAQRPENVW